LRIKPQTLTPGALGVVFGATGTNPLYALRQCFENLGEKPIAAGWVLEILSLIFWSLLLVVCIEPEKCIVDAPCLDKRIDTIGFSCF